MILQKEKTRGRERGGKGRERSERRGWNGKREDKERSREIEKKRERERAKETDRTDIYQPQILYSQVPEYIPFIQNCYPSLI